MKEITRIITAKITVIEQVTDKDADKIIEAKKDAEENIANGLKGLYRADNVQVEIQDFVMDKDGAEDGRKKNVCQDNN